MQSSVPASQSDKGMDFRIRYAVVAAILCACAIPGLDSLSKLGRKPELHPCNAMFQSRRVCQVEYHHSSADTWIVLYHVDSVTARKRRRRPPRRVKCENPYIPVQLLAPEEHGGAVSPRQSAC